MKSPSGGQKKYLRGANIEDRTMVRHIYVYIHVLRQENNLGVCRGEYRELGLSGGSGGCSKFPSGGVRSGAHFRKFFAFQRPLDWKIQI